MRLPTAQQFASSVVWIAFLLISFRYVNEIAFHGGSQWKTADWLINYSGGLVRRGLIGEAISRTSVFFDLNSLWVCFWIQTCVLFLVFFLVVCLYNSRERPFTWLIILLSPLFLLFPFYQPNGAMRKEIILFLAFLLPLLSIAYNKFPNIATLLSASMYSIAVLSHEALALFLPFFLYSIYRMQHKNLISIKTAAVIGCVFALSTLLTLALAATHTGNATTAQAICESLLQNPAINDEMCDGAIKWLKYDSEHGMSAVKDDLPHLFYFYLPILVLGLLPFVAFKSINASTIYFLFASFVATLPLYIVAVDWGRWLHIYFFLAYAILLVEGEPKSLAIPKHLRTVVVILYLTTWCAPYCCPFRIQIDIPGTFIKKSLEKNLSSEM